jgi:VanZ family protein
MGLISVGSTDVLSADQTSRFIGPLLRWLFPAVAPDTLELYHEAIRKLGHVAEFAVLGVLWYRSLAWGAAGARAKAAVAALGLSVLFAAVDEGHQGLHATRMASALDVGWDSLGALCGVAAGYLLGAGARSAANENAPGEQGPGRIKVPAGD